MDYFLQASEDLKSGGYADLHRKALFKAVELGKKCIQLDIHNGRAHYDMGLAYMKLQDIPMAIQSFELSIRDLQYADLHFNLADSYEWARQNFITTGEPMKEQWTLGKAIEHYRMAAFIYPLNRRLAEETHRNHQFYMPSEALHRMGVLLYQQGKITEAIETWRKIAKFDSVYLDEKYYKIAKEYRWQNDYKTALRILHQAYTLDSTNPQNLSQLGAMYFEAGQYKEVLPYLDKLYETKSQDTNVNFAYALVYEKLNKKQKALEWARKTLVIDSTNSPALFLIRRLEKTK